MSTKNPVLEYYNTHADTFFQETVSLSQPAGMEPFTSLCPAPAHILDAGCGSGRDSMTFLKKGYTVTAFDGSKELAARASRYTGLTVHVLNFLDLDWTEQFDGVWANASLQHLPYSTLPKGFLRLAQALRTGGIMGLSFKYGTTEGRSEQRGIPYSGMDETRLRSLLPTASLREEKIWVSEDRRKERKGAKWLHAMLSKY
ncbi:class I SAM-dependent methyltransferase [Desulfobaculum bizertense]|uniref:class I SAM-dependent methyltransferase n=1 Tax=Desulfobaculum bizertense TaxID=376490 RepID=UPI001F2B43F6|nr:class I SAM-dependent methyltransferase [Desulfobaculum bizertense]UIJ37977.1 class I SAM-dependent methyltransferase [Desulfobaculum bizertense]